MPRVTVSFKHTKEDLELYNDIMLHSDRSGYVKDILKGRTTIIIKEKITNEVKGYGAEDDEMVSQLKEFNFS